MILTPWFSDNRYGNCEIKIICKISENDVRFYICQYRVYEEINIQNTGGTDYAEQIILKAADICELLEVKQTSAYEIIGNLNKELEEQGYLTLRGKVPTKYFVKRFYGVEDTCEILQEEGKEWFHA